jgi:hypothetical protein
MTSSLDRRLEKIYIDNNIEVTEAGVDIVLDSTWISIPSSNKKIGIRRIVAEIDSEADCPFRLEVYYYAIQYEIMNVDTVYININLTAQRMSDLGSIITDRIKERFDAS